MTAIRICNLALSHLRIGNLIADLNDNTSSAARACNQFYEISRRSVLRDFNWPFAKRTEPLTLVSAVTDGSREWAYHYRYPVNGIRIVKILSDYRDDNRYSRVRYQVESDTVGKLIYSDRQNAQVSYIFDIQNTNLFDPDFEMALSYKIASHIAPSVTDGDTEGLGLIAMQKYMMMIDQARVNALNEEQHEQIENTEFIDFRA